MNPKPIYSKNMPPAYYQFIGSIEPQTSNFEKRKKKIKKYDVYLYVCPYGYDRLISVRYGDGVNDEFNEYVENIQRYKSTNLLSVNRIELMNAYLFCKTKKK